MTKYLVLEQLRNSDAYISGEELSDILGVSRTAIWKAVKSLREDGYIIEAITNKGYILKNKDLVVLYDYEITKRLKSDIIGSKIIVLDTVTSTNDYVRNYIDTKNNGLVVIAKNQTKGRAKNKGKFNSDVDGIYMSVLYIPKHIGINSLTILKQEIMNIIKSSTKDKLDFKDNEIYIGNKKVGGVLTNIELENESNSIGSIIIGIGLYKDCYNNIIEKISIMANIINELDKSLIKIDS